MSNSSNVFLSAEWLHLVFLNYSLDAALLTPFVPRGTTLDSFDGNIYVSLVGFLFLKTKMFGKFAVPFHSAFEEANLRFYVRREVDGEVRRGVVFIKEIVPKPAIAFTARFFYGEKYVSLPMAHKIASASDATELEYRWKHRGQWSRLVASASVAPQLPAQGSLQQYITEHYWGYSRQRSGRTIEYRVLHTPWLVRTASEARFEGDVAALYGPEFASVLSKPPDSAHIAEGSGVEVLRGATI